jgi:hypothetical protein
VKVMIALVLIQVLQISFDNIVIETLQNLSIH